MADIPSYMDLIAQGFAPPDITPGGKFHPGIFDVTPATGPMPPTRADLAALAAKGDLKNLGYSDIKQATKAGDVKPRIINPREMTPERPLTIEDLYGKTVRGMQSDRSAAGGELAGINDMTFREPVNLQGGIGFPRENPYAWASNAGAATTAMRRFKGDEAEHGEGNVLNVPIGMTNKGADFSHMPAQTLLQMAQLERPTEKGIRAFDEMLRQKYPDFPGIMNIDNRYLQDAGGGLRTQFTQGMDTRVMNDAGLPQVGVARRAITDPSLRDAVDPVTGEMMRMPVGTTVRFDPSREMSRSQSHGSYDTNIPGEYSGTLPQVPAAHLPRGRGGR